MLIEEHMEVKEEFLNYKTHRRMIFDGEARHWKTKGNL